jgi:hypothetical protein
VLPHPGPELPDDGVLIHLTAEAQERGQVGTDKQQVVLIEQIELRIIVIRGQKV